MEQRNIWLRLHIHRIGPWSPGHQPDFEDTQALQIRIITVHHRDKTRHAALEIRPADTFPDLAERHVLAHFVGHAFLFCHAWRSRTVGRLLMMVFLVNTTCGTPHHWSRKFPNWADPYKKSWATIPPSLIIHSVYYLSTLIKLKENQTWNIPCKQFVCQSPLLLYI